MTLECEGVTKYGNIESVAHVMKLFSWFQVQDLVIVKVNLLQVSMSSALWELTNLPVQPSETGKLCTTQLIVFLKIGKLVPKNVQSLIIFRR